MEDTVKKIRKAISLQEIFNKLSDFKSENEQLQQINERNIRILEEQVVKAMENINQIKAEQLKNPKEIYSFDNVSLKSIETTIKFLNILND